MKKNILLLFMLSLSLTTYSQKKRQTANSASKEIKFIVDCSAAKSYNHFEVKTDKNLIDYLEYNVCNEDRYVRIVGVIFAYKQNHMPMKEIGRFKVNIAPLTVGIAKYYPNLTIDESMYKDIFVYKCIFSDGTTVINYEK